MSIKIHILHTGEVCVSPYLPFGGDKCSIIKASGLTTRKKDRLWLPVTCYLIEYDNKKVLVDCGWHREMSPDGKYDVKAQIKSLGTPMLYKINQGKVGLGETIDEQLQTMGINDIDLDAVLLTHLDCDHANGLRAVKNAKRILVSKDEIEFTKKFGTNIIRYCQKWWETVDVTPFEWNSTEGPAKKSYDVFGDGKIVMINIPGHSDGQCAVKIRNDDGNFVLLLADGGYSEKSWKEQIVSGIADDRVMQKKSLEWIAQQSTDKRCVASLASHDREVKPQIIEF